MAPGSTQDRPGTTEFLVSHSYAASTSWPRQTSDPKPISTGCPSDVPLQLSNAFHDGIMIHMLVHQPKRNGIWTKMDRGTAWETVFLILSAHLHLPMCTRALVAFCAITSRALHEAAPTTGVDVGLSKHNSYPVLIMASVSMRKTKRFCSLLSIFVYKS